jgi:hypothetical protein
MLRFGRMFWGCRTGRREGVTNNFSTIEADMRVERGAQKSSTQSGKQTIEGTYISQKHGIRYRYEATWASAAHLAWSARVFIKDVLFSTPSGSIAQVTGTFDPNVLVKAVVHQAIERGDSKI